jgi:lipid-A-disaccharide synthase
MTDRRPLIHLVAGEESGDLLGAALMRALRQFAPGVRFGGVGGRHMTGEGIASPFPIEELSIVGIGVIARKLPLILRRIRETAASIVAAQPDALVIIDSPDFTHRVARKVRAAAPRIPILNYAPPSIWAWRPWRAKAMRAYVDEALAILPFEPAAHEKFGGPPCTYVGHPLAERLAELRPNAEEERRRHADPPRLLVLPGSRGSEIRRLAPLFGAAIDQIAARTGPLELVLPTLPHIAAQVRQATADWTTAPRIVTDVAEKYAAFRSARAALAASGTVTLELVLAGVPMVAAYRVPAWEGLLVRALAHVNTVILANLVLGEKVVPEYLQRGCTPKHIAAGLMPLLADSPERRRQADAFTRLDAIMDLGGPAPSARAAARVLDRIGLHAGARIGLPSPPGSC